MSTEQRLSQPRTASLRPTRARATWLHGLCCLSVLLSGVLALDGARPAHAQVLNDEIVRLLDASCEQLVGVRAGPLDPNQFGPNLIKICEFPTTQNGASSGGGTASVQSSTTSIQNGVLQRRLARARSRKQEKGTSKTSNLFQDSGTNAYLLWAGSSGDAGSDTGSDPGLGSRRFDIFGSGSYERLDRDLTGFEDGYESSIKGGTIGADYRFSDSFVAGLVATYSRQEGDFDGGGDFEVTSFIPTLFVAIVPTKRTFIQVVLGHTSQQFDVSRDVMFTVVRDPNTIVLSGVPTSETDGRVYSGSAQFGYDYSIRNFTFGPRVGVNYSRTTIDELVEDGSSGLELRIDELTVKSLQGVAGIYGSVAISAGSGVFLPQMNIEYVHEFEDSPSVLDAQFAEDLRGSSAKTFSYQTNEPDSGYFNVELGVAAVLAHGIQPYINVRTMLGNTNFDSLAGTLGIRFEL